MPLKTGDKIGAYEIVAPLGQGGMATVFKAFHARLNRFVAIKMIHQAYNQDANYLARFEREAQIVAGLEHPHIVPVYDYSEHEGEPYLVMKLIEGSTLKAILSAGALTVDDILTISTPIASALDYAHTHGVLHRDIKPSNIILDKNGTPYLSDFGLARLSVSGASTLSQDLLMGTPYYISPEQARGDGEIDYRADLYSFGVVLYELFVGKVPFSEGTPYSIINDHVVSELPLPSTLNPNIAPAVELVLLKALSKNPADRYPSADAMIEALRSAIKSGAPQVTLLNQGRRHIAEQMAAPVEDPNNRAATLIFPAKRSRRKLWLWAGGALAVVSAVGFVVMCVYVVTSGLPSSTSSPPTTTAQITPSLETTRVRPPQTPIQTYDVPEMTANQARNLITQNPNDPVGYLALARAQLQNNEDASAKRTLTDGLNHVPDRIRFEMTAAALATQIGRYDAAFAVYSGVLQEAVNSPSYPAVRAAAGGYLYQAATAAGRLTLIQIRALSQELITNTSPVVSAMIGRAFLASGMPRLAKTSIDSALGMDNTLAEAHLVNGEYEQAQGDTQQARSEWQIVLQAPDAPPWVRERANQLITSTN